MRLATFNVNSVKVRLPGLLEWLAEAAPDIVLLQEIKCQDENFPANELAAAGYQSTVHGQKAYNGVAILSRHPMTEVQAGLPDPSSRTAEDEQARFIAATICGIRVHSLYVPNGNPTDGPKYPYKLSWLDRLIDYVEKTLLPHECLLSWAEISISAPMMQIVMIRFPCVKMHYACRVSGRDTAAC